jgi:hypothetical protein
LVDPNRQAFFAPSFGKKNVFSAVYVESGSYGEETKNKIRERNPPARAKKTSGEVDALTSRQ